MSDAIIQLGSVKIAGSDKYVYTLEFLENGINLHKVAAGTRQQGHYFFIPANILMQLLVEIGKEQARLLIENGPTP